MKYTHTPGKWIVVSGEVVTEDGRLPIARMVRDESARGIPPTERDRNAHITAAGPEMLEALESFPLTRWGGVDHLQTCPRSTSDMYPCNRTCSLWRAAIAKAREGEL